ncbi:hypothetical protein [Hyphomicrobium sp. CS1GBMeth3]|uniref:hypothetical protein n=1 Tax=Hyphomicrobium sp. CS1GBMeth3 TaxID=1892845 RepID=UPI000AF10BFA|nr:hypothetical protein [Hyphomicrobium sp. CS1GBMeth3]
MAASQPGAEGGVTGHQTESAEAQGDIDEIKHVPLLMTHERNVARLTSSLDWEYGPGA